jgi:hypothetical protein
MPTSLPSRAEAALPIQPNALVRKRKLGQHRPSINKSGQITGYYQNSSGQALGFVYGNGTYTTMDGSVFTDVMSINNSGQVTCYYEDSSGQYHGFIATPATHTHLAGAMTLTGANVACTVVSFRVQDHVDLLGIDFGAKAWLFREQR